MWHLVRNTAPWSICPVSIRPAFGNPNPYGGGSSPAGTGPAPSSWETFYTNEGTPYFVNNATGVTQWETPPGVRVDM